ncbi:hypothetical protein ACA910_015967 [Epithemia clementina (nom. ined.)]
MQNSQESLMNKERRQLLETIGFDCDPLQTLWTKRYKELVEYAKRHGDCLVPKRYADNPELGNWVATQRQEYRKMENNKPSFMNKERQQLLEKIGFDWDPFQTFWTRR